MPELIDKAKVLKYLTPRIKTETPYGEWYNKALEDSAALVALMPTIEAEPVRHGHWETVNPLYSNVYCSECGAAADKYLAKRYKGCPFCLCVMDATDTNVGGKGGDDNG